MREARVQARHNQQGSTPRQNSEGYSIVMTEVEEASVLGLGHAWSRWQDAWAWPSEDERLGAV